jgi:hypothetical protein
MSTSEPEVPGGTPRSSTAPRRANRGLSGGAVAGIAILAFVIAGLGGYFLGHSKGEDSGKTSGYDDGVAAGRAQIEKNYREGAQGYEVIFARGRHEGAAIGRRKGEAIGQAEGERTGEAEGRRVGFEAGQRVGIETGETQGVTEGASAVLGGFDDWTQGSYYIVTAVPGTETGVPFTLSSRKQVEPGTDYHLCSDGSLCEAPVAAAAEGTPDASLGSGG